MDIKAYIELGLKIINWIREIWRTIPEKEREKIIQYILKKWEIILEKYYDWYNK